MDLGGKLSEEPRWNQRDTDRVEGVGGGGGGYETRRTGYKREIERETKERKPGGREEGREERKEGRIRTERGRY